MTQRFKSFCFQSLLRVLAAAMLLSLTGCQSAEKERASLRIGVALYTLDDTFISAISAHLERLALEAEARDHIKINLSIVDGGRNQTAQLGQIDRLLNHSCDVLCVNIVDRTAAAVIIDKAEKAQVPIIFFNRQPVAEDIQRWGQVYYVGAQAMESGILQGQLVLDGWRRRQSTIDRNGDNILQYVMLEGEPGHQDALLRTEYATKPLTDAGIQVEKLDSNTANWNRGQASVQVSQWIQAFGDEIEVVFSNNDDMALGAIDAFRDAGIEDLPFIVGVDATAPALEAVAAGNLQGTVQNDAVGIAGTLMALALAIHSRQSPTDVVELVDDHYVWLPYRQVSLHNLNEFLPS